MSRFSSILNGESGAKQVEMDTTNKVTVLNTYTSKWKPCFYEDFGSKHGIGYEPVVKEVWNKKNCIGKWNNVILHMYLEKVRIITFSKYEFLDYEVYLLIYISWWDLLFWPEWFRFFTLWEPLIGSCCPDCFGWFLLMSLPSFLLTMFIPPPL